MNLKKMKKTLLYFEIAKEAAIASKFILVGVAATFVHIFVLWLLLSYTSLPALVANVCAFLTAFGVSFSGHYLWTFSAPGDPLKAVRRFLTISSIAFLTNTLLLAWLLRTEWLAPMQAAMLSVLAIPCLTFLGSRLWAFGNGPA